MQTVRLVAVLTSDKVDFKIKSITRYVKEYCIIKGSIHQEDTTILNLYVPNNRA